MTRFSTLAASVLDTIPARSRTALLRVILSITSVKLSRDLLSAFSIWYASSEMAIFFVPMACLCVCMCVLRFTSCCTIDHCERNHGQCHVDDRYPTAYSALGELGACHIEPGLQSGYSMFAIARRGVVATYVIISQTTSSVRKTTINVRRFCEVMTLLKSPQGDSPL